MNKIFIIILVLFAAFAVKMEAQSQFGKHLDVNLYGGYMYGDYFTGYEAEGKINQTGYWGAALSLSIDRGFSGELHYQLIRPTISIRPYGSSSVLADEVDVSSNWFLIGSLAEKQVSKPLAVFGYLGIGAVYSVPVASQQNRLNLYTDSWAFGVAMQGGLKYMISDKVGFRGYIALNMPMQFSGGGFYFGTGGSGMGVSTYTSMFLFNMGGGLIFRLM